MKNRLKKHILVALFRLIRRIDPEVHETVRFALYLRQDIANDYDYYNDQYERWYGNHNPDPFPDDIVCDESANHVLALMNTSWLQIAEAFLAELKASHQ